MGHSNNKIKQMVPALCSGNDFVVTYYFDFVALSQLRDALNFLLQEGEACPGPVPREESYVSVYSVSTRVELLGLELPFMLCAFVSALFLLVSDLEQYQSSFPHGSYCLSSRWSVCSTARLIQLISCTINPVKVSCPGHAQ